MPINPSHRPCQYSIELPPKACGMLKMEFVVPFFNNL